MSRIGRKPVLIPQGVSVSIADEKVLIEGPKGKLEREFHPNIRVAIENGAVHVTRSSNLGFDRALHGLVRSLIQNMVLGVTQGFSKELDIEGIGFRAQVKGGVLSMTLGFSHPIEYPIPPGITIEAPKPEKVIVRGLDKELVGQTAANIRRFFEPEPYKGKGIRYTGEVIRRKQGKTVG